MAAKKAVKRSTKKVAETEESLADNVSNPCEVCGGKGRVSEKESCEKCEGTGVNK